MKTHISHCHLNLSSLGTMLPPLLLLQNRPVRRPVLGADALILRGSSVSPKSSFSPLVRLISRAGREARESTDTHGAGRARDPSSSGAPVGSLLSSRRSSSRARRGRTGGRHAGQEAAPTEHPPRAVHTGPGPALSQAGGSVRLRSAFAPRSLQ